MGNIMITPVYTQNVTGRYVYLPEKMTFVKFMPDGNIYSEDLEKGVHFVKINVNEVPLFIRENVNIMVVKQEVITNENNQKKIMDCSIKYSKEDFEVIGVSKEKYSYKMYNDDGISKDYML